jgi:iron(III) transport system ATP-binding protein
LTKTPALSVSGLRKLYATNAGVEGATFDLMPGTFFTLLGPSGCGKTTTLRCIAGLEEPDGGIIRVGSDVFFDAAAGISVPLNHRGIGMVFQSYAIWPHMTVFENVAFPLRVAADRSYDRAEARRLVGEALAVVDLAGYESRSATQLSGGQQQRVALARAIVRQPRLLLLDEPLSNLDAALREGMRKELKRLQQILGITTIYVTHDQAEALEMSDLIAVLNRGRIVQIGPPREIYFAPQDTFVASFVGTTNLLPGTVESVEAGLVRLSSGQMVRSVLPAGSQRGSGVTLSVRPEMIVLMANAEDVSVDDNRMTGIVEQASFIGSMMRYAVRVADQVMQVYASSRSDHAVGASVVLAFPHDAAYAIQP